MEYTGRTSVKGNTLSIHWCTLSVSKRKDREPRPCMLGVRGVLKP